MKTIAQRNPGEGDAEERLAAVQVWLPETLLRRAKGYAGLNGLTMRELFRDMVTRYLEEKQAA